MSIAIQVDSLTKSFGKHQAVDHLNLQIPQGMLYGFLGSNGAGKTTTLRMLAGLLAPDSGDVMVGEHSITHHPQAAKQLMAYMPDEPMLYGKLRPLEYLEFVSGLWNMPAHQSAVTAVELLKQLGLWDVRGDFCETFSRGMKQKLALAGALIHEPAIIVLDEPLSGLDVAAGRLVKNILLERVQQGCTVILTTHIMEVAEQMAERIGIIHCGQLIAEGTLAELRHQVEKPAGTLENIFLELTQNLDSRNSTNSQ